MTIRPHLYMPDYQAMGDCRICGHDQDKPWHISMPESPLRDLARKLRAVAREHIAFSQVAEFMNHLDDHLSAMAFAEEVNRGRYETTPAGVIDWKAEAERANWLLAAK